MKDYIASRYDQFIKDLKTIVDIDSGSHYAPGIDKIVAFFQKRISQLGWYTKAHSFADGKVPCLECVNINPSAADAGFDFLFLGHMDTVFLEGTAQKRPFAINRNLATGPGVCDMKGGLVAVLHVIEACFQQITRRTHVEGVRVEVLGGINRPPMVPSEETLRLWEQIAEIGARLGQEMKLIATGGGSDGNFTSALGTPTIDGMGPRGGRAHSEDEFLRLESVIPTVQLICEICKSGADGKLL